MPGGLVSRVISSEGNKNFSIYTIRIPEMVSYSKVEAQEGLGK
jgi:hypothetical protein